MPVKLDQRSFAHAKQLVGDGKVVLDDRDAWSELEARARPRVRRLRGEQVRDTGRGRRDLKT
jgi:hypothetical protein